jgi:hypothetical protein
MAGRGYRSAIAKTLMAALLTVATAPSEAWPARSAADAREILQTVLALEARVQERSDYNPTPCVSRQINPAHVRGHQIPGRPARTRPYRWFGLAAVHDGYIDMTSLLAPPEQARIQAAELKAGAVPSGHGLVRRLESDWLGPPLRFCPRGYPYQHLELSSPVIGGDTAFVSVDFQCGICGQGVLLALRRSTSGWEIVAGTEQWVS